MLMRLRQICLAVPDMEIAAADLRAIFDIEECHRDPLVDMFGLANVLLPIGPTLIELVTPIRAGSAVGRFLQRRLEGGGYIAIFNCDEVRAQQQHVASLGIQIANVMDVDRDAAQFDSYEIGLDHYKGFYGIQLHPRDCGAAMIEFNWTPGGEDLYGPYAPAGHEWSKCVRRDTVLGVLAIELQSPQPERLASHWGAILQCVPVQTETGGWTIQVENGQVRVVAAPVGAAESMIGLDVRLNESASVDALCERARSRGHIVEGDAIVMHGMRFHLCVF